MKNVIRQVCHFLNQGDIKDPQPDVRGMTSAKVKILLNKLVGQLPKEESYFEVGVHRGATFIGALHGHREVSAVCCDNWSQFADMDGQDAQEEFYRNLKRYQEFLPSVRFVDMDVWEFLKSPSFEKPVGIVFYDGDHKEEDQRKLFSAIYPYLAKESIVVVDDYEHPPVMAGSEKGVRDVKWSSVDFVLKSRDEGFHNGVGLYFVVKQ